MESKHKDEISLDKALLNITYNLKNLPYSDRAVQVDKMILNEITNLEDEMVKYMNEDLGDIVLFKYLRLISYQIDEFHDKFIDFRNNFLKKRCVFYRHLITKQMLRSFTELNSELFNNHNYQTNHLSNFLPNENYAEVMNSIKIFINIDKII